MLDLVAVAKAALCEAGRPDLARGVYDFGNGHPAHKLVGGWGHVPLWRQPDREILLRAFVLAYRANGMEVEVYHNPFGDRCLRWEASDDDQPGVG